MHHGGGHHGGGGGGFFGGGGGHHGGGGFGGFGHHEPHGGGGPGIMGMMFGGPGPQHHPHYGAGYGGGFYNRGCPPPRYGCNGYYYNSPGLVVGALLGGAVVGGAMMASNNNNHRVVYVRERQQLPTTYVSSGTNSKRYYVDVPNDVYPGETFRVELDGEEMLVTCPDVSGPGERIIVSVEHPSSVSYPPHATASLQPQPYRRPTPPAGEVQQGVVVNNNYYTNGANAPSAPGMPEATNPNYNPQYQSQPGQPQLQQYTQPNNGTPSQPTVYTQNYTVPQSAPPQVQNPTVAQVYGQPSSPYQQPVQQQQYQQQQPQYAQPQYTNPYPTPPNVQAQQQAQQQQIYAPNYSAMTGTGPSSNIPGMGVAACRPPPQHLQGGASSVVISGQSSQNNSQPTSPPAPPAQNPSTKVCPTCTFVNPFTARHCGSCDGSI
eukprot:gene24513-30867_t